MVEKKKQPKDHHEAEFAPVCWNSHGEAVYGAYTIRLWVKHEVANKLTLPTIAAKGSLSLLFIKLCTYSSGKLRKSGG